IAAHTRSTIPYASTATATTRLYTLSLHDALPILKSYIRVHMNEEMAKEVTIHNQLNQIQSQSDKVMSNMQSILNTQGKMLQENAENLQAILINGHEEMEKSNNKTVKAVQE